MPHERLDTSNRLRWRNTNAPREGNPALSLPPTLSVEATTHYRRSRGAKTGATLNITDILQSGDGSATLAVLAKAYGISPGEAGTVLGQVAPALANRIERNTLSRGGVADMLAEVANPAHGAVLADPRHAASHAARLEPATARLTPSSAPRTRAAPSPPKPRCRRALARSSFRSCCPSSRR